MPENENYIGVAMGLDVSDLKSGLAEASKRIGTANADFRAASSEMDNWQQSIDGVQAKVNQLDTVLQAQRSKLAGLTAEYQRVVEAQGENSQAARNLYIRMQNQQAVVNQTEREFNNYTETLREAQQGNLDLTTATLRNGRALQDQGNSAEESSSKMDGLKSVAKGVGAGLLAVGAAAVGVVGGFLSLAESTRETRVQLGQLETAFTNAGHSAETARDTVEELTGVLGDQQQATETAQQLAQLAKSEQELTDYTRILTGVYATWGESLKVEGLAESINHTAEMGVVNGNLADALEWSGISVDDFNAQLATLNTEEERSALITETLNGLYGEAADKYNEVNKDVIAAQEAQSKLNNAMADLGAIAEPIMTTLKLIAVDLLETITPFVQLIGEGLTGALNGSAEASGKLAEGIAGILNALVERLTNTLPLILNIILELIPSIITTLLNALPSLLDTVTLLVTDIINLLAEMLPTIVQSIVDIIPQLITALVNAIPDLLQAAITLLMAIVESIPIIVQSLTAALPQIIDTIINVLVTSIPILIEGATTLLMAIIDAFPTIMEAITTNLPKIIDTLVNGLVTALPLVLDGAIQLLMAIIDAIPVIIKLLAPQLPTIIKTITKALSDNMPVILKAAVKLLGEIVKAIPTIVGELISNMPEIISAIVKGLSEGASAIKDAGLNIVKGIWEGIKSGADWIKDKISGFAGDVAGWFKKAFKIKSPSQLMRDEVGLFVGEGIGEGVLDSMPYVKQRLGKFSNFISDNLGGIKSGLSIDTGSLGAIRGGAAVGGSTIVNAGMNVTYNGNLSRKQLKQLENDNYNAIKLKLRKDGAI